MASSNGRELLWTLAIILALFFWEDLLDVRLLLKREIKSNVGRVLRPLYLENSTTPYYASNVTDPYDVRNVTDPVAAHTMTSSDAAHTVTSSDAAQIVTSPDAAQTVTSPDPADTAPSPDAMRTMAGPDTGHDPLYRSLGKVKNIEVLDLEAPGNLQKFLAARSYQNEIILMSTDAKAAHWGLNMVLQLRRLGMDHLLIIVNTPDLCPKLEKIVPHIGCAYSSFLEKQNLNLGRVAGLWTVRKYYFAKLAAMGYGVWQLDTDVIVAANPYSSLKQIPYNIVLQSEGAECTRSNGGVIYAQGCSTEGPAQWALMQITKRVLERLGEALT
ncbi:hypothetical protein CYMTET_30751 [Cymbomonas tetramitiformis]|uniref:Nucleotide-diphospho-sugar transferase domain-containing protein n=1 Tax=Cymbomonas tetramitiformis TaxID=36881 RepID=A0AAE0KTM5_9CHLO|nr:hypothetical protein CYMTET_30751 [Cymbomonas tetramitiformis]